MARGFLLCCVTQMRNCLCFCFRRAVTIDRRAAMLDFIGERKRGENKLLRVRGMGDGEGGGGGFCRTRRAVLFSLQIPFAKYSKLASQRSLSKKERKQKTNQNQNQKKKQNKTDKQKQKTKKLKTKRAVYSASQFLTFLPSSACSFEISPLLFSSLLNTKEIEHV